MMIRGMYFWLWMSFVLAIPFMEDATGFDLAIPSSPRLFGMMVSRGKDERVR